MPAQRAPVARICVDLGLAHLDRPFDYLVPEQFSEVAQPGVRVRVRMRGQLLDGFLLARAETSEHSGTLAYLERVVSPEPVLSAEIAALERSGKARNTLPIASPAAGVVLEKKVVRGQNVAPGMELYTIADLSTVWAVAQVYQADLALVRKGSEAEVELAGAAKPYRGVIAFVSPVLDPQTRTAEVRVELRNTKDLDIKPEMIATVVLRGPARKNVLAVPEQAIIRSGRRTLAIVALGAGYFEPREVTLGAASGGYVEVTSGLEEGDGLVVSSQFLIDSESNLKAAVQRMQAAQAAPAQADSGMKAE